MVSEFGMTSVGEPLEGAPTAVPTGDYALSDQTRRDVDKSAQALASVAYSRARKLVATNRRCLEDLAAAVLESETLTREDLDELFHPPQPSDRRRGPAPLVPSRFTLRDQGEQ
jgi:cell division protease FtsH